MNMRFMNYTFPSNPERLVIKCERSIAKHKYVGIDGEETEDLHPDAIVVTGSGTFFGNRARQDWNDLLYVYRTPGVGLLITPLLTMQARFKNLQVTQEPGDGSISFEIEFWEHIDPIRPIAASTGGSGGSSSAGTATTGGTVQHTVKQGDTLWNLAGTYLKDCTRWAEIASANGIKDPKKIQVGQVLKFNVS